MRNEYADDWRHAVLGSTSNVQSLHQMHSPGVPRMSMDTEKALFTQHRVICVYKVFMTSKKKTVCVLYLFETKILLQKFRNVA